MDDFDRHVHHGLIEKADAAFAQLSGDPLVVTAQPLGRKQKCSVRIEPCRLGAYLVQCMGAKTMRTGNPLKVNGGVMSA
jgi:hypothetical protein